ncbi:MAG TPA: polyhydroxyalkanoic acid system family protein [Burkholderiaceae bacterium]|nr:polyhydroxyalkanoic acid system family protein [Burkholderiaceae bacterium]
MQSFAGRSDAGMSKDASMSRIRIHREHSLGLKAARDIAWRWAEQVEVRYAMERTVVEGKRSDTVEFMRAGVRGKLAVAPDHFDLHARLGILFAAFAGTIEGEIRRELDELLYGESQRKARGSRS